MGLGKDSVVTIEHRESAPNLLVAYPKHEPDWVVMKLVTLNGTNGVTHTRYK